MRQVLFNLVLNAVEAMPEGGELELRVEPARRGVAVFIRDSGPGISAQTSHRLFEPFQTTKAAGSGLGLVLSRRIAEKHGGRMEVQSQVGRGTTMTILLPSAVKNGGPEPA